MSAPQRKQVVVKEKSILLMGPLAMLLVAALFAVGCSGTDEPVQEEAEAPTRPDATREEAELPTTQSNIIFVLADDLDLASAQKMPGLRSLLVEEGASFERAFVSHPVCCPSRATILTGLYDHNHDVKSNLPPDGGFQKFVSEGHEESSIAVQLQKEGYRTALFGKYLNGYTETDPTHVPSGWDEWYGKLDEQELYDYRINENGEIFFYGKGPENFFTDVLTRQATDFVRRAAPEDRPFFAYVAPTAPHSPATPAERHEGAFADEEAPRPPSFNEEDVSDKPPPLGNAKRISEEEISDIDAYHRQVLRSMLAVDEMVASLVQELEAAGELDETFIFFVSDNGWQGGEHRIRFGKNRPYEESVHVPFFVRGPGVPAGSKVERLALNTDLAPTFAALAGASFASDGRSLAPLLLGEEPASWRSAVLLERFPREESGEEVSAKSKDKSKDKSKEATTGPGGMPKGGVGGSPAFKAVRTESHKYVEYDNGETELYDLEADPYELDNVYESAGPSLVEDLKTKLDALEDCAGEGCREAEDAP